MLQSRTFTRIPENNRPPSKSQQEFTVRRESRGLREVRIYKGIRTLSNLRNEDDFRHQHVNFGFRVTISRFGPFKGLNPAYRQSCHQHLSSIPPTQRIVRSPSDVCTQLSTVSLSSATRVLESQLPQLSSQCVSIRSPSRVPPPGKVPYRQPTISMRISTGPGGRPQLLSLLSGRRRDSCTSTGTN